MESFCMIYCHQAWGAATLEDTRRSSVWVILVQPVILKLCSWAVNFSVFTTWYSLNGNRKVDPIMVLFLCVRLMLRNHGSSRDVSSLKILLEPVVYVIELGVHALDVAFDLTTITPNIWSATNEKLNSINDFGSLVDHRKS
jgi:hypothetical protein